MALSDVHDGIWRVPFYVIAVLDGDTIRGDGDLGWGVWKTSRRKPYFDVRVQDLWCPERGTPAGDRATAWAKELLRPGTEMTLHSLWVQSFVRVVGHLFLNRDGSRYADVAVAAGHGTHRRLRAPRVIRPEDTARKRAG